MSEFTLLCHPTTPCDFVHTLGVRVDALGERRFVFHYQLEGDLDRLLLPPRRNPAHVEGLWRRTCFEAFIAPAGTCAYLEFNFSPSSAWAMYRFDDYRTGMQALQPDQTPRIVCRRHSRRLETDAEIHLDGCGLSSPLQGSAMNGARLGLTAVLQDVNGAASYWALAHPPGKPDFHHRLGFTAALPQESAMSQLP